MRFRREEAADRRILAITQKSKSHCEQNCLTMTSKRKNWQICFTIINKEINLIYPSVRYDQMNQSTVPALTTALVWSDMHGVMLARTPYRFKFHISAKITKAQLVKNQENNQTFSLLVDMTETLPALAQHLHWWGCPCVDWVIDWGLNRQHRLQWFPY